MATFGIHSTQASASGLWHLSGQSLFWDVRASHRAQAERGAGETTQIVTGSIGAQTKPSAYEEYVNANKGKVQQKGKGWGGEGKGGKQNWRLPCSDYWKPDGCQHGHHCPKHHPRPQPGRCAICGSTWHSTSQCTRPVKPKAKSAEYEEDSNWQAEAEWHESTWKIEQSDLGLGMEVLRGCWDMRFCLARGSQDQIFLPSRITRDSKSNFLTHGLPATKQHVVDYSRRDLI